VIDGAVVELAEIQQCRSAMVIRQAVDAPGRGQHGRRRSNSRWRRFGDKTTVLAGGRRRGKTGVEGRNGGEGNEGRGRAAVNE